MFDTIARKASRAAGTPWIFGLALATVLAWGASGPLFGFNDTWQLVINTGTTIVTFLMVFLIQHTQNADTAALHLKLDELIRATRLADNRLARPLFDVPRFIRDIEAAFGAMHARAGRGEKPAAFASPPASP